MQLPIQETPSLIDENFATGLQEFPSMAGLRILVVDDDLDNRELIGFILEQQQAQVILAESAAVAFDVICQTAIDLVISDVGMPDEDGYSQNTSVSSKAPSACDRADCLCQRRRPASFNCRRISAAPFKTRESR